MLRPPIRYALTRDGVTIAYSVLGDSPFTLIVVPGLVSQVEIAWEEPAYEQFMSRLTAFARVVTLDRRGTGLSDPVHVGGDQPDLARLALDVEAVLNATGTDRAAVFGYSLGSMTALQFAADFPDRVSAVIVIGAGAKVTRAPDFPGGHDPATIDAWADQLATVWGAGLSVESGSATMAGNERYRAWAGKLERHTCSPGVAGDMVRVTKSYDVRAALPRIQSPALVLQREHDRVAPVEHAHDLTTRLPDATFVELPGEDHTFFLGDQRITIEMILRFLDKRFGQGQLSGAARRATRPGPYGTGWWSLTPGERQVAILVASGLTNKEIAERLRRSPHTVDGYLRRVFAKLDVSSRVGVAAEYSRVGGES